MTFPIKDGTLWTLDPQWVAEIETCYPYLPVRDEFSKAKGWLLGNPTKRKTARGMTRYLIGWLNRAEDSRLQTHRQLVKQQGPKYVNIGAWTTECQDEHGGTCGNQHFHRAKMQFAKPSQRASA